MPWCHLFLMMPLFSLAAFVFLPWATALPLYLVISVASLLIYTKIIKALHAPVATGREGMIGREALIILEKLINYHSELWEASSQEELRPGERVQAVVARPEEGVKDGTGA